MARVLGPDDANPHGIERPVLQPLSLSPAAVGVLDQWAAEAIGMAARSSIEPITSFVSCLTALLRMGGTGHVESPTLIVVDTPIGLTVGMHRDGKGVCSLNS